MLSSARQGTTGASASWQREVPEPIRALDTLANPDYADIFTTAGDASASTPEQVFRAALAGVPASLLLFMRSVQRLLLGFRLGPRKAPDHVEGWKIAERGENHLRIETASWFMTAHCILHRDHEQLSLAAFIRYDRPIAGWIWRPVSLIHRQVGLALMRHAAGIEWSNRRQNQPGGAGVGRDPHG